MDLIQLNRFVVDLTQRLQRHRHDGKETQDLIKDIVSISGSFETGEQSAIKVYFPMSVRIKKIRSHVTKALAATDTGTITGSNSIGNSTDGVVTVATSAAINDEDEAVPIDNNVVVAGSYYKLTFAKTTAGGKVQAFLEFERILI